MCYVGHDAADFCAGEDHIIRLFGIEEILDRLLIPEIEFGMRPFQNIGIPLLFEFADTGASDHSAMAADKDFIVSIHDS
jgi:hypothetical protein